MSESEFQSQVLGIAKRYGWLVYHVYNSKRGRVSSKGFPDLVLAHEKQGRVVFAELKDATGKLSPQQVVWLRVLDACRVETVVWRPSDLPDIAKYLSPA